MRKTENIGILVLHNEQGYHTADKAKAEALNEQFSSVFNTDHPNESQTGQSGNDCPRMTNIKITQAVRETETSKSCGT